jgi:hypothetical protein
MLRALAISLILAGQPDAGRVLQDVQRSHNDANVPAPADFNRILTRDLKTYFESLRKQKVISLEFDLLRDGPTQSGVSSPKFYIWVRLAGGKSPDDRGAVRVAAVERTQFEVMNFVSERIIRNDKGSIRHIFPAPVCEAIDARVGKDR